MKGNCVGARIHLVATPFLLCCGRLVEVFTDTDSIRRSRSLCLRLDTPCALQRPVIRTSKPIIAPAFLAGPLALSSGANPGLLLAKSGGRLHPDPREVDVGPVGAGVTHRADQGGHD